MEGQNHRGDVVAKTSLAMVEMNPPNDPSSATADMDATNTTETLAGSSLQRMVSEHGRIT